MTPPTDPGSAGARQVRHQPIMPMEVLEALAPTNGEIWVDATTGAGGHTRLLAERVGESGRVIALDRDAAMLELAKPHLAGLPVTRIQASFDQLDDVLAQLRIDAIDGLFADLGICSDQLDDATRGLSFNQDGPLDMRMDAGSGPTAADLLARMDERELANVIFQYGEERHSRRIARRIVEQRRVQPLRTTGELADLVRRCVPRERRGFDPATRTFQALRIAVNDELAALDGLLVKLPRLVKPGGRVGFLSFHSLEDRRVKQSLKSPNWAPLTKKPLQAGDMETGANPRSRSAKFRAARRSGDATHG